jgi:hypothetical protein
VDKTADIHSLISTGKIYFLSRPHRFGKSLLVSTMEALFKGEKHLFEGLYIYDKWDWSQQYPVIRIDWTQIPHPTVEEMEIRLFNYLKEIAGNYQVTLTLKSAAECFRELILVLHEKTGKKVVILIDEYDQPITKHLFDDNLEEIRKTVHDFYQIMKGSDEYLKFIFLTGVSKFSGLSVFSALNNTRDITLSEDYASICGYTQEELENNFYEYLDSAAEYMQTTKEDLLEDIRSCYDGYTWDGKTSIYNPFSTLLFFAEQRFDTFWFDTGTPTFLIDIIQRQNRAYAILDTDEVGSDVFKGYDPVAVGSNVLNGDSSKIGIKPLLFQTGYLTIKKVRVIDKTLLYTLGAPNSEVHDAFMKNLLKVFGKYSDDINVDKLRLTMQQQINDCDKAGFTDSLEAMIATIPYQLHRADEAYYHSITSIWMRLIGFKVHNEVSNNIGRADIVWEQPWGTVIAEIKYHAETKIDTLLDAAITQIHDRRYYNSFIGKKILLGIAFSGPNVGCRMEVLDYQNKIIK